MHLFSLLLQGTQKMPRAVGEAVYERSCAIVLDGLRTRRGPLLPGGPLTLRDITE